MVKIVTFAKPQTDKDGKNCYPRDEIWMTGGYGDYIRHYLRAMAWLPELAPADQNHLLTSTSLIQLMEYPPDINKFLIRVVAEDRLKNTLVHYRTFDIKSTETYRLIVKPSKIFVDNKEITESADPKKEGWNWKPLDKGGVLTIRHLYGNRILVMGK